MASKKKILILYASAGHGHEKAARAVDSQLRTLSSAEHESRLVDILKFTSFGFGDRYRALYFFMIRTVPWLWGFFYSVTDLSWVYFFVKPFRRLNNHFFAGRLEEFLLSESPDVVISTHFLGTEVVSHLKKKGRIQSRLVTVVTDYMPHAFWITRECETYAVATQLTKDEMARRGVSPEKILVTGIPIEPKFSAPLARDDASASLGLDQTAFTVLITSGGAGVGIAGPLVDRLTFLEPPVQQLVICGTNKQLLADLRAKYGSRPGLHFYGFVDNVHELMAASDLLVGKGGGLTITECLCMGKPMVLFGAVPGQETRNVDQVVGCGAARNAGSLKEVVEHVTAYRQDPKVYRASVEAIQNCVNRTLPGRSSG